ncbi:MAG: DUF429 domain-containing protein [Chloroflexi bacterium]|nr:DUF429 domain-containing protein [Chloroflexota bacterium]
MPTFIGLDLAWTTKNESGICWLEGDSRENLHCTRLEVAPRGTESLAGEVAAAKPAVVTVDAPLVYTPQRWADKEISKIFGRYKAGAHSSHAAVRKGWTAGIDLGQALNARGFTTNPKPMLHDDRRVPAVVEVFPHPIHVRLFGLQERIPYKKKQQRSWEFCQRAMRQYQRHLRNLISKEAPGILEHPGVQRRLDPAVTESLIGVAYKRLDDALDGLTCAISAWMMWNQPERWEGIGDENGCIVVPRDLDWTTSERSQSQAKPVQEPPVSYRASIFPREQPPELRSDPEWSVKRIQGGLDIKVSSLDGSSSWEIRVRLEGDDLSRVVTVVERLE